jgi:hypothetical protein
MTERFFPTYGYGSLPPRAQVRVGTGGFTEYKGSASDGGGSVRLSVNDSPHDAYTAYGQLEFSTGHADEDYTARMRTYQGIHDTNGQYGQLQINPPSFIDDGWFAGWWAREYSDTGSPAYSKVFSATGVSDHNNDNPWEAITYWARDSNVGGYIQHYAGNHYWYNNPDSGGLTTLLTLNSSGNLAVTGSISKGSGTFDIAHPVLEDKRLRHSFIEGPQADLIYRGTVTLGTNPTAISMDTEFGMAEGTWEALNCTPWSMAAASGEVVEWSFEGDTLTITGDEGTVCNWMVIGERHDPHMIATDCTDGEGRIVLEYDQPEPVEHIWE